MSRFLIDTNIVSAFFKGEPQIGINIQAAERVYLCSIVLGELYFGMERSLKKDLLKSKIQDILNIADVLHADNETTKVYGRLKSLTWETGTPIPENDVWIASFAVQHHLPLVTRDAHFDVLTEVQKIKW